jgi:GNAT superfamily N-acetyltransferase
MTGIEIHIVTADDIDDLLVSVAGLFQEDGGVHDSTTDTLWPARHGAEYYGGVVDDDGVLLALARIDGRSVGHVVGKFIPSNDLRLVPFAVLESIRTDPGVRSTGVGSRLVEYFKQWARDKGAQRASVTAFAANERAQRFYARHGFAPMSVTLRSSL